MGETQGVDPSTLSMISVVVQVAHGFRPRPFFSNETVCAYVAVPLVSLFYQCGGQRRNCSAFQLC